MTIESSDLEPGRRGGVASSQPLATDVALDVLREGGSAVDAAVTAMAMISVLEPMSCGLGGDAWAMIWDPEQSQAVTINGSGPTSSALDVAELGGSTDQVVADLVHRPGLSVTVPGALRTWKSLLMRFGRLDLSRALEPAVQLAREGFPVQDVTAWMWAKAQDRLAITDAGRELLPDGIAPDAGERVCLPQMADTLEAVCAHGADHLYNGPLGLALVETVSAMGGVLHSSDLAQFQPEWVRPIEGRFRDLTVFECPPNSQGVATLATLSRLEDPARYEHVLDPDRVTSLLVHMETGLAAARELVGDPHHGGLTGDALVAAASQRPRTLGTGTSWPNEGDTAAVVTVDSEGMACALLSSLYANFGTGIVVPGTGIALHNRASRMSLDQSKIDSVGPRKRPRHTLTPAVFTVEGRFNGAIGVVGGHRQPQVQVQVISALADYGMTPQSAVDMARVGIDPEGGPVGIEHGMPDVLQERLTNLGYETRWIEGYDRVFLGGAQLVTVDGSGEIHGASDPRKDGAVATF
jgi:gamma-glutamyltranspeptidase/glutathione hydrolase